VLAAGGLVRVSDAPGRRHLLPVAALTPLDDAGKDPAAGAQIDLVVGATDPDRTVSSAGPPGLPCRRWVTCTVPSTCPAVINRNDPGPPASADPGSQTGSQHRQASGHIRRQPAMVGAARWPIRPHPATCSDGTDAPEKRTASGSTPPLTTGSDLRKRALSDHTSAICDECCLILGPAIASGRSLFPRIAAGHTLVCLVQPAMDQRWFSVTGGEHSLSREAL
jgi:hypothetical protein